MHTFKSAPEETVDNLNNFLSKAISEEEFNFNNAMSMINDIKNMRFKIYPTTPDVLLEYRSKIVYFKDQGSWDKLDKIKALISKDGNIKEYFKQYNSVEAKNFGNYWWLNWCKKILGKDFDEIINPVIQEFREKDDNVNKYYLGNI